MQVSNCHSNLVRRSHKGNKLVEVLVNGVYEGGRPSTGWRR